MPTPLLTSMPSSAAREAVATGRLDAWAVRGASLPAATYGIGSGWGGDNGGSGRDSRSGRRRCRRIGAQFVHVRRKLDQRALVGAGDDDLVRGPRRGDRQAATGLTMAAAMGAETGTDSLTGAWGATAATGAGEAPAAAVAAGVTPLAASARAAARTDARSSRFSRVRLLRESSTSERFRVAQASSS